MRGTRLWNGADIGTKSIESYVGTLGDRRHVITGSPHQVVVTIERLRKSGLEHLVLSFHHSRLFKEAKRTAADAAFR
jgi:hypothetical protein